MKVVYIMDLVFDKKITGAYRKVVFKDKLGKKVGDVYLKKDFILDGVQYYCECEVLYSTVNGEYYEKYN